MALCCYSRDYRGGPFTSMNQLSAQLHSMQKAFKNAQGGQAKRSITMAFRAVTRGILSLE